MADTTGTLSSRVKHALRPWRQANPMARKLVVIGLIITVAFAILAIFADVIAPYGQDQYRYITDSNIDPASINPAGCGSEFECEQIPRRVEPGEGFPFGTTNAQFDVMSRLVHGARVAFSVVALATMLSMAIGVPLGLYSGYRGGTFDKIMVMTMDAIYAFPPLILAILVAFVLKQKLEGVIEEPGVFVASIAVGVVYVPQYFRVIRNHTLSVKEEPFVEAARSLGAPPRTIVWRYVFFNVTSSVPVIFTLNAADAVLTLAGLGFLGFGVEYPRAEWGLDVARGLTDAVSGFWWTAFFPGLAIMLLVTGLTLVGEGLNDIVNPLLRVKGYRGKVGRRGLFGLRRRSDEDPSESTEARP